ncbi:MAG: hypothetical protein JJ953_07610 [Gracilimonas sp.]|uniref:hypothetical protein n=1 Tax=Gracilimonas TaxID=649462 RepID=UPI001B1EA518|nr:hypothetical protein [Gracilimonas sp.]MBO6585951.1 hypothetical protein [Gracilimonas sp.]MBO6616948.1 hypothetical protein [Gracilimonas sp.]
MYYSKKNSISQLILPLLFAVFISSNAFAQTPDIEAIKAGDDHYWGEFCSQNQSESESAAIDQLLSKIAVNIESSFTNKVSESITDNQGEYKQEVEGIVKTYSSAQLKNLKTFKEPRDCGIYVFRYIQKSSVNEIFENRKQLVKDIFDKAEEFEEEGNFANALKYYYFSIILLNSIPESTLMHNGDNLYVEPGFRIPSIMQSASFEVLSDEMLTDKNREITLAVLVDGEKAKTLDFSFWDGNNSVSAKSIDGTATINLYGSSTMLREIQINVKYDYYENRGEIKEVSDLWNLVQRPPFKYTKRVRLDQPISESKKEELKEKVSFAAMNETFTLNTFMGESGDSSDLDEKEIAVSEEQLKELVPSHLTSLQEYFNSGVENPEWQEDEFLNKKLTDIEDFNNLSVSNNTSKSEINKTRNGWEFRQLTTTARYPSINLQTKEYLVPDLDSTGSVKDVNFGVMDGMYDEFRRQSGYGNDWDKRQVMIKFVEKYRTAYLTRNVEQLGTMFAEQAVIITGRVLKVDNSSSGDKFAYEQNQERQPDVEYLRETKKEFLERQTLLFASKPDIHLGFSTFNILRKNNQEGIYGISMRQSYQSTNYSDEGYLFLLIDFNSDKPKIYVRAWQPKEWSDEALVELGNFKVNS